MKIRLTVLVLSLLSFSVVGFSSSRSGNYSNLTLLKELLICTEEAPILCKYFNLNREEAVKKVQEMCAFKKARLKAVWRGDRIENILCHYPVTNHECIAKGADCAIDGQCVMNGEIRPNVQNDKDFYQAMSDVENDPADYFRWPSIFYVCQ